MAEQTCFTLKNANASQEIRCPYCNEDQNVVVNLVTNILRAGMEEPTTCICYNCKKEFTIDSIELVFFTTGKIEDVKKVPK